MPNIQCPGCKQIFNEFNTKNHDYLKKGAEVICHNQEPPRKYLRKDAATVQYTLDQIPHVINDIAGVVNNHEEQIKEFSKNSEEVVKLMRHIAAETGKNSLRIKKIEIAQIRLENKISVLVNHLIQSCYAPLTPGELDILNDEGIEEDEKSPEPKQ